jgi:hypothetical protein
MFADKNSIARTIADITKEDGYHSLYIGAHGDDTSIGGIGGETISRTELRNILNKTNSQRGISGLYFGSCLVATQPNASFWLTEQTTTGLKWIAGYSKNVDWIDSSAVDMIFWSKYLHERKTNRSRKKGKSTDLQMVREASSQMKRLMPTVFNELGFNVYHCDTGGSLTAVW